MVSTLILMAAAPLLGGLLYFSKKESIRGQILTKPFLSALFIAAALAGPHADQTYFILVLAGLILCLVGDVFLIFFLSKNLFLAGLISFLAGHLLYTISFFSRAWPGRLAWMVTALCLAVSGAVFGWLRPHLGRMLIPVIAYMAIITVMVIGAASLAGDGTAGLTGRVFALTGALLFYGSDIFVARQRFVTRAFVNRLVGLPLYYTAQFMIAFSTRLL
jgi:uncharacterized membrane protein YhhN